MESLKDIAEQLISCRRCSLYKYATQAVPGEGNSEAKILFVGEGPGFWEDQKGIPFCGPSGKLLDELLSTIGGSASGGQSISREAGSRSAGKLAREDVFITNVVKHRPPQNRDPLPEEVEACSFWLDKQIKIIDPKIIVTLGRFSMTKFFPGEFISKIHGTNRMIFWNDKEITVMPMYHPAAALRDRNVMAELKSDFLKLGKLIQ